MKTTSLTEHTCANCKTKFHAAALSDFSYGEFLLWSGPNSGVYLDVFEDDTYQEVINLLDMKKHEGLTGGLDMNLLLRSIYGELACDADSSGRPYHLGLPPCPHCGSTTMASVGEKIVGKTEIGEVTHEDWHSFTEQEKVDRLVETLRTKVGVVP